MNEHDSERMSGMLQKVGYQPAATPDDAEMIILNTCSIREKAEQKFYSELGRLTNQKEENSKAKMIAVAGCIAQQEGRQILSRVPNVDLIIGPSDITRLPELVRLQKERHNPVIETSGDETYHHKLVPVSRTDSLKAWVSIMYGCNNFCSYCVVPYLRGRERSRPAENILAEIQELAAQGYKEVTLLGQNVNSYGNGTLPSCSFPELLRRINDITGIERIRFVTSHPKDLSDDLISAMRDLPKVCESLHLPLQSGSDRILSAMNRKYSISEYQEKINKLRNAIPDISLTTDIIVGFPGEGEADFQATLTMLKQTAYDGIFAFKYSRRPNTAALKLKDHLSDHIKDIRLSKVFDLQKPITLERNHRHIGAVLEVFVDGKSKRGGKLAGRTRGNKVVNFEGAESMIGRTVNVCIKTASQNSLAGILCE